MHLKVHLSTRILEIHVKAIIVWGGEAKNGSTPPTRGLRVRERERQEEKKRDKIRMTQNGGQIHYPLYTP